MPGPRKQGVTTFDDSWLANERFKRWLKKVPGDSTKTLCILCNNKKIDIANMGVSTLVSHKSFKKHNDKEKAHPLSSMFFIKTAPAVDSKPDSLSTNNPHDESDQDEVSVPVAAQQNSFQTTLTPTTPQLMTHDAAIRWSIKIVLSHFPYRSNVSMRPLFGAMFPDREVAKQYMMSKDKFSYFVLYGIAPVFKEELITIVNKSSFYSIGFDESLNHMLQDNQMDIHI